MAGLNDLSKLIDKFCESIDPLIKKLDSGYKDADLQKLTKDELSLILMRLSLSDDEITDKELLFISLFSGQMLTPKEILDRTEQFDDTEYDGDPYIPEFFKILVELDGKLNETETPSLSGPVMKMISMAGEAFIKSTDQPTYLAQKDLTNLLADLEDYRNEHLKDYDEQKHCGSNPEMIPKHIIRGIPAPEKKVNDE